MRAMSRDTIAKGNIMNEVHEAELVLTPTEMEIQKSMDAIAAAEVAIQDLKDLNGLKDDPRFINIMLKKYTIVEPQRILTNLTAANYLTREERLDYVDEITAISKVSAFYNSIEAAGHNAHRIIEAEEYRIAELEKGDA